MVTSSPIYDIIAASIGKQPSDLSGFHSTIARFRAVIVESRVTNIKLISLQIQIDNSLRDVETSLGQIAVAARSMLPLEKKGHNITFLSEYPWPQCGYPLVVMSVFELKPNAF